MSQEQNCPAKFKQIYDRFYQSYFCGGMEFQYIHPFGSKLLEAQATTGFPVNKDLISLEELGGHFYFYHVFDHIRTVEEILTGLFKTENEEFSLILKPFLREFMMYEVYVIYSEEFRLYELNLLKKECLKTGKDFLEHKEKAYPDSNFRLLRRIKVKEGKYSWDALLSGLHNISDFGEEFKPIRFSFNDGFMFKRLFHIFSQYEAQMQTYKRLFLALHKVGDINGEDAKAVDSKKAQLASHDITTQTLLADDDSMTTIQDLQLVDKMPQLEISYNSITTLLNDSLARLGLAGDDSTKCARITTGENFRALQPNMAFKEAIKHQLENVTHRIQKYFAQLVEFEDTIQPNEQGIPVTQENNNNEGNKS